MERFVWLHFLRVCVVQCSLSASTTEEKLRKVADVVKRQNVEIKKEQEEVNKLLMKIEAAIEVSCAGKERKPNRDRLICFLKMEN